MTNTTTQQRPEDVVSPITDGILSNKITPEEARKAGRFGHNKPTPTTASCC
jgi:hypothetical protein